MQDKITREIIKSPQAMQDLWADIAQTHKKILLYGELWAGKTLFTKWFALWLGIDQKIVQSPTYTYINNYDNKLLHADFYRLENYQELVEKWILEEIYNYEHNIIERPKFEEKIDYSEYFKIKIIKTSDTERIIEYLQV